MMAFEEEPAGRRGIVLKSRLPRRRIAARADPRRESVAANPLP
ncbi:hypothetical protein [Paraburkholderia polaris]|nr:hypothetical protein [Paraburkholderia polaris]